ncbi:MAG: sigma-70 family RNA polymerase sigma factor [Verrucomicrobia bacterium]|nr:sigma-70 family RNA polymerase sigma factor [Verrucomicrobiota bacterium]
MAEKTRGHDLGELSDEDLMWLLRKENMEAFECLARRYDKKLLNFLFRFVSSREQAEDLVQRTLLKVYHNRLKFRNRGKFSTWMYTIAANLARDHLRRFKKYQFVSLDEPVGENSNIIDFYREPEENKMTSLEEKEMGEIVRIAIDHLPAAQRMAILLSYFEHMSYDDIAQVMSCPKGTVKSKIFRAKARLKELLINYVLAKEGDAAHDVSQGSHTATSVPGKRAVGTGE